MRSLMLKYRPTDFATVCGQNIITEILERSIQQKRYKHAYCFAGPSGCGKTTIARILANKINNVAECRNSNISAYTEIDAASNNGVDQVRAIIDSARARNLTGYEYKIFIIDEAHMITTQGWNAFLKSIEEPSEYTIFIFCTTELSKIPATIRNRVEQYTLARISNNEICDRLKLICQNEGFVNYEQSCDFISKLANGGMRDAINFLDQCATYSTDLSIENVKLVLGDMSAETMLRLSKYLIDKDVPKVLATVDKLYNSGNNLKEFLDNYIGFVLDLLKYTTTRDLSITAIPTYLNTPDNAVVDYVVNFADSNLYFMWLADLLLEAKSVIRYDDVQKSTIETYLLKACRA